ncbi:FCD domain-containing protein [Peribacillus cavernae]|uniref:FCD domain-containing protein n=1 Tax=Peribacillus cavernae TaxID=1674310 RepID=A0A3S0UC97_9BACI|nr:FCD domain-containing protein [Peribacillus cavernae]MDQ0217725.1 DNA-binding FadR family transcriptional regulator [Peribacillus cavernae]RUQ28191.1 FCD domain-containing protein [Peribacillus cavernae]
MDYKVLKQIFELVVSKCNRATRRTLKIPKELLIVDSTTITVGETRLPWAVYHGERYGVKLHVSCTPETGMPLKVMESTGLAHDGPLGEKGVFVLIQNDDLENADLIEMDLFSSKADIVNYLLLRYLLKMKEPVGSWVLQGMLEHKNVTVSTATIGRFLKSLDAKGYTELVGAQVRVITNRGVQYVNELSEKLRREKLQKRMMKAAQPQNPQELLDIMSARKVLECEMARLAAIRAKPANIKALEQTVEMHAMCLDNCDDSTAPALDFHGKVAEASNIRFLIASLDILMNEELKLEPRFLEVTRERAAEYALHHKLIADAIKNGDAVEEENQMRIHMDAIIAALEERVKTRSFFYQEK